MQIGHELYVKARKQQQKQNKMNIEQSEEKRA